MKVRSLALLVPLLVWPACSGDSGSPDGAADGSADAPLGNLDGLAVPEAGGDGNRNEVGELGATPLTAQPVDDATLAILAATGDLTEVAGNQGAQQEAARAKQAVEDRTTLDALLAKRPDLRPRIEAVAGGDSVLLPDGNYQVEMTDQLGRKTKRILLGQAARAHQIASNYRRFNTAENQLGIFNFLQPNLPSECGAGVPTVADAKTMTTEQLITLNRTVAECWLKMKGDLGAGKPASSPDGGAPTSEGIPLSASGYESDTAAGDCPHGDWAMFAKYDWPGKANDTSVKDQGARGSCGAFATVGAMENAVGKYLKRTVNLSEQCLYAKEKLSLDPDDFHDGVHLGDMLVGLANSGWAVPLEGVWPYNPSPSREFCTAKGYCDSDSFPNAVTYRDSCVFWKNGVSTNYAGPACSDTSHQAKLVKNKGKTYFWTPCKKDNGMFAVSGAMVLFDIEGKIPMAFVELFVLMGQNVVIGFDDYQTFHDVKSLGKWHGKTDSDYFRGGHAVQVSGVLFNEQLESGDRNSSDGWLVIKNSWGTCWGDGGYGFMNLYRAGEVLNEAVVVMPSQPVNNLPPTVTIVSPKDKDSFAFGSLTPVHLKATTSDYEDGTDRCKVTWTSDVGGVIGKGNEIDFTPPKNGPFTITAKAVDSMGKSASAQVHITVTASPPVPSITAPAKAEVIYTGTSYVVQGSSTDGNLLAGVPCTSLTWSSSVKTDAIEGLRGCQVTTQFTTIGARTLTLTATNSLGMQGKTSVAFVVADPPPKTPPVVTITTPLGTSSSSFYVANPTVALKLSATVSDPGGYSACTTAGQTNCVSYVWKAVSGTTSTTIGTTPTVTTWVPSTLYPANCGGRTAELQFCATDPNGTTCKSTFVRLYYPPC